MRIQFLKYGAAIALLLSQCITLAGVRDQETAEVKVYHERSNTQTIYTYSVTNKGDHPIIGLTIGYDYYRGDTQLSGSRPLQIFTPSGWSGRVVSLEESDRYEISWDILTPGTSIAPGQTLSTFRVATKQNNNVWTNSNWTVIVSGPQTTASDKLKLILRPAPNADTGSRRDR